MAGAGYKLFSTGDVLSASDVNTYLQQQTVMVFASAAARTTALSGVLAEGMVSYLKDTDVVEIYTGASWVSLDDPNAIQNSLLTAKGSIVTATAASTPSALAVGANNTVLTADSSTATGLKWATPAAGGGGKVLQVVNATYSTEFTSSSVTFADTGLTATITPTLSTSKVLVLVSANGIGKNGADTAFGGRILRGATTIFTFEGGGGNDATAGRNIVGGTSASYLDSPATTSATTYKVQGQSTDNAATAYMNWRSYGGSSITLLEIGA